VFFCLGFLFFGLASSASAANYYWVGGTTNSNTSNPQNWNTSAGACADSANATVPTTGDSIIFVSNCLNNATVDSALSVAIFYMQLGYTGTTTVSAVVMNVTSSLWVDSGTLYITNGGTVTAPPGNGNFIIGWRNTSNGTVTVAGAGSTLTQTISGDTRLRIGNDHGSVGNLNILNGAVVNTGNISGAYSAGATANITVDGAGTIWNSDTAGSTGYMGRSGTATLTISNGAVVNTAANSWHIGGLAGSIGSVNVTGTGSRLNITNANLRIGYTGTGTVNVNDGGILNISGASKGIIVADLAGSTGTLNIGTGYTTDVILANAGIRAGLGTASLPPIATTTITASNININSINWDWDDDSRATGYKVYRSSDNTLLATISSSTSNWTQESLSPNTPYSIYYRGTNAQGEGISSASTTVYTLADTPTNLSASSNSNSITLSVDSFPNAISGQSGYYFSRSGANSGWIQTNSWTDTGLSCGNSYTYSVKYRNGGGTETSEISITKSTSVCPSTSGSSVSSQVNNLIAMGNYELAKQISNQYGIDTPSNKSIVQTTPTNQTTPSTFTRNLELGMAGADVRQLQQLLNKLGFTIAPAGPGSIGNEIDLFGKKTQDALIKFQKDNNITPAIGYFGPLTKKLISNLNSTSTTIASTTTSLFTRDLSIGSIGEDVKQLQIFLNTHGYTVNISGPGSLGNETTTFGPATQSALIKFQTANKIVPAVGYFGSITRGVVGR
jgi:T5SS/PEP-CTERM-associated repeat protein